VTATAEKKFRSLFGRKWSLSPNFTFFRRHRTTRYYLDWHIDADAGGIINVTDYSINSWLPLDPVGDLAPSLELIPGSNKTMRELPPLISPHVSRTDEWVKQTIARPSWIPPAMPGDAILFDHWTLHRTQQLQRDGVSRTSCEFRFVRAS
jgi:ectoine hydroxylase-related dioxygenase (phytanoyl-CoA dioxygenase family)